jgi:hypothetical protein
MPPRRATFAAVLVLAGCTHPAERPSPSGAGTYVFVRYHAPCMYYWQCVDPPLIRSAVVLLDRAVPRGSTCSARQGFTAGGCYVEDAEHGSDPTPVAWRRLDNGDIEVGLACGLDSTVVVTLSGDEGRVRNVGNAGEPAEWPLEVKAKTNADDSARCAARLE